MLKKEKIGRKCRKGTKYAYNNIIFNIEIFIFVWNDILKSAKNNCLHFSHFFI